MAQSSIRNQKVSVTAPRSSKVDLSNQHITTLDFCRLQPVYTKEMIPGDTFNVDVRMYADIAPLATKVFGSAHVDLHAFFVPSRILWSDFNNYILGNDTSTSQQYTPPYAILADIKDFFGLSPVTTQIRDFLRVTSAMGLGLTNDTTATASMPISMLPIRAYQQIWWDYYRDSVAIPESNKATYLLTDGGQQASGDLALVNFMPKYRCFKKDYITTALPSPQLGDASRTPVELASSDLNIGMQSSQSGQVPLYGKTPEANSDLFRVYAQGSGATDTATNIIGQFDIAALRAANALQRYLERFNVSGTRPLARIMALFGQKPMAERLDMAEFIGQKSIPLNIRECVSNSGNTRLTDSSANGNAFGIDDRSNSSTTLAQGASTGQGNALGQSDTFRYHATEHGFFMVIASVMPDYVNINPLDRMFMRGLSTPDPSKFDYYTPDFDGIGYQELLLCECAQPKVGDAIWGATYDPYQVVGYQPKYEDYRISKDYASGDFILNVNSSTLPQFIWARDLTEEFSDPTGIVAGIDLTTSDTATRAMFDSHFSVTDEDYDHFMCNFYIVNDAVRPITAAEIPTELSNLANSSTMDLSNGGVRL